MTSKRQSVAEMFANLRIDDDQAPAADAGNNSQQKPPYAFFGATNPGQEYALGISGRVGAKVTGLEHDAITDGPVGSPLPSAAEDALLAVYRLKQVEANAGIAQEMLGIQPRQQVSPFNRGNKIVSVQPLRTNSGLAPRPTGVAPNTIQEQAGQSLDATSDPEERSRRLKIIKNFGVTALAGLLAAGLTARFVPAASDFMHNNVPVVGSLYPESMITAADLNDAEFEELASQINSELVKVASVPRTVASGDIGESYDGTAAKAIWMPVEVSVDGPDGKKLTLGGETILMRFDDPQVAWQMGYKSDAQAEIQRSEDDDKKISIIPKAEDLILTPKTNKDQIVFAYPAGGTLKDVIKKLFPDINAEQLEQIGTSVGTLLNDNQTNLANYLIREALIRAISDPQYFGQLEYLCATSLLNSANASLPKDRKFSPTMFELEEPDLSPDTISGIISSTYPDDLPPELKVGVVSGVSLETLRNPNKKETE